MIGLLLLTRPRPKYSLAAIIDQDTIRVQKMLMDSNAGMDVNVVSGDGWTPFQLAIKSGMCHLLPDLFRAGARWPLRTPGESELPIYQVHSPMRYGTWHLGDQVNKLALYIHELLQRLEKYEAESEA